jgi:hypothetical protein
MAYLGITGAMRTAPTAATEVLLGFPHYTCRWKRRPRQEITDYIAVINGNQNPKVLDTGIRDSRHEKRTHSTDGGLIK